MNTLEFTSPQATDVILDTDPTVSMDIGIGKKLQPGEVINVNYPALRQVLEATGAPEDRSDSTFVIDKPLNLFTKTYRPLGWHHPEKQETHVRLNRSMPKLQKVIQHELRHYGDGQENPRSKKEILNTRIGNYANRASVLAIPPSLLTSTTIIAESTIAADEQATSLLMNTIEVTNYSSTAVIFGALALSAKFYWSSDREKIARAAEKLDLPQVITIDTHSTE